MSLGELVPTVCSPHLVHRVPALILVSNDFRNVIGCCTTVCFLPIQSGHQVRWAYEPGSHRRKVTQDFSSTFFLRCVL